MISGAFIIRSPTAPTAARDGRYEYRIWPRQLPPAVPLLQSGWSVTNAETRADIYLLTRFSPYLLVKLRAGTDLEVKQRHPDLHMLQYWTLPLAREFPLSRTPLDRLTQALGLPRGLGTEAGLSPAHLLAALTSETLDIRARIVRKSRVLFRRGSCRAEITQASWAGQSRLTVALEDPDPESMAHEIGNLQLLNFPNRSYGDVLSPYPAALMSPHASTGAFS